MTKAKGSAKAASKSAGQHEESAPSSEELSAPVTRAGLPQAAPEPANAPKPAASGSESAGKKKAPRTMFLEQAYTFNGEVYGPSASDDHLIQVPDGFPENPPPAAEPFKPFELNPEDGEDAATADEDEAAAKRRRARARRRAAGGR